MELASKIVVVTGGASGIGRALCRRFKAEGAQAVVVVDMNAAGAEAVAVKIGGVAMTAEVSKESDILHVIDQTEHDIGPIDLFCSNAGIARSGGVETPDKAWQKSWEVNVMSHIYAARALVPRMIERGGGYLLNTVSAAGLLNQIGSASYGVTKHAAIGFGEWLAITHGHQGIKVSLLCPQAVRTAMLTDNESTRAASVDGLMEPEELAEVVIDGLRAERFLILPHPEVLEYMRRKTGDYDRWLKGMNRLQERIGAAPEEK
jgi:NAD(P)-dependent dehydrogenase (short-subunit alcohol dehydrogenase family)